MRTLAYGLGLHHFLNSSFHFLTCARLRNERESSLKKTKKTTEPRRDNRGNRRKKGEKRGNCNERDQYKREMWEEMEVLGGKFWDFFPNNGFTSTIKTARFTLGMEVLIQTSPFTPD